MALKNASHPYIGSFYTIPGLKYREPLKSQSTQTMETIIQVVGDHFDLGTTWVVTKSRRREYVLARQVSMYFIKKFTRLSLNTIGEKFGGRDHTTVIHSIRMVNDLMRFDQDLNREIIKIECQLI